MNDICQDAAFLFEDKTGTYSVGIWGGLGNVLGQGMGADIVWCWANRFEFGISTIAVLRY